MTTDTSMAALRRHKCSQLPRAPIPVTVNSFDAWGGAGGGIPCGGSGGGRINSTEKE